MGKNPAKLLPYLALIHLHLHRSSVAAHETFEPDCPSALWHMAHLAECTGIELA